jgi:hypothetical protein
MTTITHAHRPKRPPRRKKAKLTDVTVPKIVTLISRKHPRQVAVIGDAPTVTRTRSPISCQGME